MVEIPGLSHWRIPWVWQYNIVRNREPGPCEQQASPIELKCPWFIREWVRFSQTKATWRYPLPDGARELSGKPEALAGWRRQFGHFPGSPRWPRLFWGEQSNNSQMLSPLFLLPLVLLLLPKTAQSGHELFLHYLSRIHSLLPIVLVQFKS